jgi:hypothetical protein
MRLSRIVAFLPVALIIVPGPLRAIDIDADGLDDVWEISSFGDLTHAAQEDTDGDRFPNLWEQAFSTSGANANAKPRWAAAQTRPGIPKYYRVDKSLGADAAYAKRTINAALSQAANMDIIEVEIGDYAEPLAVSGGRRLLIFSTSGASKTTLMPPTDPTFYENITFDGFTIRRGGGEHGVLVQAGEAWIKNCIITGASDGVRINGGTGRILHCTVAGNRRYGVVQGNARPIEIVNSIVWGNTAGDINGNSNVTMRHSVTQQGKTGGATLGAGMVLLSPGQTPCWNRIYELLTNSPARNAGEVWPGELFDSHNELRANIASDAPDAGADEFLDSDSDGLPDWMEIFAGDPAGDADDDGATNLAEYSAGTDIADADSDNDSLKDGWELANNFDPLAADPWLDVDGDRIPNAWEFGFGTDGAEATSKPSWSATQSRPGIPKYYMVDTTLLAESAYAKKTINAAISAALNMDIIEVKPGDYHETPNTSSKHLLIFSTAGARRTTISPSRELTLAGNVTLDGFSLRGVAGNTQGILTQGGECFIKNCVITGAAYGIWINGGGAHILHCTVAGNTTTGVVQGNSRPIEIVNSIVWGNTAGDINGNSNVTMRHSVTQQGKTGGATLGAGMVLLGAGQSPGWTPRYQLMSGSPAIGAGEILREVLADANAELRLNTVGDLPDAGADEFIDSDSDGLPDWWEGGYPADADPSDDSDRDGAIALVEYQASTDPLDADSDNDSLKDGWELVNAYNPLSTDGEDDTDADRFPNVWEYAHGTNGADAASRPKWSASQSGPGYYIVDGSLMADTAYEKRTITAAVSAAANHGVVEVRPGTYSEAVVIPSSKRLEIFSTRGAASVLWRATANNNAVQLFSASIVDGITLRSATGTAVYLNTTAGPELRNCIITGSNNGIYQAASGVISAIRITHCTVSGNSYGLNQGAAAPSLIRNSVVSGNTTSDMRSCDWATEVSGSAVGTHSGGNPTFGPGVIRIDPDATGEDPNIFDSAGLTPDFHLLGGSPLINRGTILPSSYGVDLDGCVRRNATDELPDIGADELDDRDGDQLADWWEQLYFGNLAPQGADDGDGDGLTNIQEQDAGTNPMVTNWPPQLSAVSLSDGRVRLTINGPEGSDFAIEASSNLVDWSVVETNVVPPGGACVHEYSVPAEQKSRFYRATPRP